MPCGVAKPQCTMGSLQTGCFPAQFPEQKMAITSWGMVADVWCGDRFPNVVILRWLGTQIHWGTRLLDVYSWKLTQHLESRQRGKAKILQMWTAAYSRKDTTEHHTNIYQPWNNVHQFAKNTAGPCNHLQQVLATALPKKPSSEV